MAKKAYNELNYAYAVARLSALEARFLKAGDYEKLLNAESADEAEKIISNLGWKMTGDFEDTLEKELLSVFDLIESLGGGEFLNTQRIKYDYHNLKALIKGELTGQNSDGVLTDYGSINTADMKNAVINRDYKIFTENMKNAVQLAYDQYARTADVQLTDIIFDSALLCDMLEYANNQPEDKILDLVKTQIDMHNIKSFIRIRKMGKAYDFTEKVTASGGHIPKDFYLGQAVLSKDSDSEIFGRTPYSRAFTGDSDRERELDNIFMEKVKKARMGAFGLAPLAAYFWMKENEIRNVRIILTCKRAGIGADAIRQRLRG